MLLAVNPCRKQRKGVLGAVLFEPAYYNEYYILDTDDMTIEAVPMKRLYDLVKRKVIVVENLCIEDGLLRISDESFDICSKDRSFEYNTDNPCIFSVYNKKHEFLLVTDGSIILDAKLVAKIRHRVNDTGSLSVLYRLWYAYKIKGVVVVYLVGIHVVKPGVFCNCYYVMTLMFNTSGDLVDFFPIEPHESVFDFTKSQYSRNEEYGVKYKLLGGRKYYDFSGKPV